MLEPNFKLFYKILRQSIAVATNQDANKVISIAPYFSMLEAEGKVIPKKIGVDFTNRLIAESGLSGVNWSVGYHALAILMENLAKETPKRKGGELLFNKLEATFYGERQQFPNVRSDSQSGSLLVCPKCGEIFPDERALRLHSTKFFTYCQRKCKECRESDSPCDITRSVGACTTCRSAGMICRPMSDSKAYKKKPWQCGKCFWRYHGKSKLRHIEDDCIGRCNRCQELDLPCRVYSTRGDSTSNPSGKTDCIFCLKVMEQCVRSRPEDLIMDEEGMDS
jgi:hypothetical protein